MKSDDSIKNYIEGEGASYINYRGFTGLYLLWALDFRAQEQNPSAQLTQVVFEFRARYDVEAQNCPATALIFTQKHKN